MVEEKKSTEVDDWLDDTEASDDFAAELDQDNIDALLGSGVEGLDDTGSSDDDPGDIEELDQANIDALLGGESDSFEEADLEDFAGDDDQTNLDDLMENPVGDMTVAAEKEPEDETIAELGQANIDALLGGDDDNDTDSDIPQQADQSDQEDGDSEDDDLDIFLGGGAGDDATESDGLEIEQDEIDRLFAGLDDDDDDDLFQAEEIDFAEVLESGTDEEYMDLGGEEPVESAAAADKTAAERTAAGGESEKAAEGDEEEPIVAQSGLPFIPEALNKTTIAAMGATLLLVIAFCIYFFMPAGQDQPAIPAVMPDVAGLKKETLSPQAQPAVSTNFIPVVSDVVYAMPQTGGEVPVMLTVEDKDDNALVFSLVSQPQHGRLSGNAPAFTYLPDTTFPGEDRFEYSVSDGKDTSGIATVVIRGPNLVKQAMASIQQEQPEEPKMLIPEGSIVSAMDVSMSTKSTSPVLLDFGKIWQEANGSELSRDTYLDIDTSNLQGKMVRLSFNKYRYIPDPYYSGTETFEYRFKKGGISSGKYLVTLDVALGNPAPEIRLAKLEAGYLVGQTVSLDVTQTRDEMRKSLRFEWHQVGGVPVQLDEMNEEGSMVSFVMPSSFYTEVEPGPSFRLIARDETGKTDTLYVKVPVVSRRQAALWRAENGLIAEDPSMDGRNLPWPYRD
ncbi:MAG: Ig-like domain-containing protein [Desulfobulbaceae bacterium]|uniref:Ig-like domain-containing protein n=1 Tax=Candidatus Desulfobia pelagia TaxID=2841692 RepID=A0A8J6NEI9_9BACT|nr:Ig-like domain-containing protein [Candidatus Desulfobia pelagia]